MAGYRLSRKAAADLADIYEYTIQRHGLTIARQYFSDLRKCCEHLARYPMLGRRIDRIASGVRRYECQSHVVFYVPDDPEVRIVRVLHARMDVTRQYPEG